MASRPVFLPLDSYPFVEERFIEFTWHPGFAKSQSQKNILSLHQSACNFGIEPILEISSKSFDSLGKELSAFNLSINTNNCIISVECAYQGSKLFTNGGPFSDLYFVSSREAKKDERIKNSGDFIGYQFFDEIFPSEPTNAFYDWLYLTALFQNPNLSNQMLDYQAFSDIAFNPKKSLNCQARSAALFVSLTRKGILNEVLDSKSNFIDSLKPPQKTQNHKPQNIPKSNQVQLELPI